MAQSRRPGRPGRDRRGRGSAVVRELRRLRRRTHAVRDAADRDATIAAALEAHGENGRRTVEMAARLPASDAALFTDPVWLAWVRAEPVPAMFASGLMGTPTIARRQSRVGGLRHLLHWLPGHRPSRLRRRHLRPEASHHTDKLVPGAELRIVGGLGHFSIVTKIVPALVDLLGLTLGAARRRLTSLSRSRRDGGVSPMRRTPRTGPLLPAHRWSNQASRITGPSGDLGASATADRRHLAAGSWAEFTPVGGLP